MRKTFCWLALSLLCAPLAAFAAVPGPAVPATPSAASAPAAPEPDVEALFQPAPLSTSTMAATGADFRGYGVCSLKCNFNCLIGVTVSCPAGDGFCVPRCGS